MAHSQIRLKILPSVRCFFDKLVHIKVEGLAPHKPVQLRSRLVDDKGMVFSASAQYKADAVGQVDVCRAPSLGGSYTGVEPMGLFWAMSPETPHNKLLKKDVLSPVRVEIEARCEETGEVLASETNEREFMMEGMKRIPVKEGRIRGVLFIPPGNGPFPGIVDLYTFGGRLTEVRASLLANQGFVVLALAYLGYQDLPKQCEKLDLEYFEEALTYLRGRTEVEGPGIGIISISHSGALALSMASFLPGISATVLINSCIANTLIPVHYKDIVIPPLPVNMEDLEIINPNLLNIRHCMTDSTLEENRPCLPPIERASSHFLFAASEDDHNWRSVFYVNQAAEILRRHGKESFEVVTYPNAGHFLEVPNMPFCQSGVHGAIGMAVTFGGEPKAHAEAQLDLWGRVLRFFKRHLVDKSRL